MTTTQTTSTKEPARHPFEIAGLGAAPYRVIGFDICKYQACPDAPVQPGTSCDYCSQGIMYVMKVQASDGKQFKVGCDCVMKVGKQSKDYPSQRPLEVAARELKTKIRHERERATIKAGFEWLSSPEVSAKIATLPHPYKWQADKGLTMADYVEWMKRNAGNKGKLGVIKDVKVAMSLTP